jgi:hypothetical protein
MNSANLNSIGLLLDIVGAILIYKFGFPFMDVFPDDGGGLNLYESSDVKRSKRIRRDKVLAKSGLVAMILGFIVQLTSNYM